MINENRRLIAENLISFFLTDEEYREWHPTVESINEGSCGDFASMLNGDYKDAGLSKHITYCTFDFISPTADGYCEYLEDWKEDSMKSLGITSEYFNWYKNKLKSIDSRCVVGYHVWLFDGEHHYDATCLEGVSNPLELPFFQNFIR